MQGLEISSLKPRGVTKCDKRTWLLKNATDTKEWFVKLMVLSQSQRDSRWLPWTTFATSKIGNHEYGSSFPPRSYWCLHTCWFGSVSMKYTSHWYRTIVSCFYETRAGTPATFHTLTHFDRILFGCSNKRAEWIPLCHCRLSHNFCWNEFVWIIALRYGNYSWKFLECFVRNTHKHPKLATDPNNQYHFFRLINVHAVLPLKMNLKWQLLSNFK